MFRTTDLLMIAVMVLAAAFTYTTKHDAERLYAQLRGIRAEIRHEMDTINILKADWSLLTQPMRLQRLAEAYKDQLGLEPIQSHQIVGLDELPAVPPSLPDTDRIVTGGTRP